MESAYTAKLSFGLSLSIWEDPATKKVKAVYVSKVKSGSPADVAGITPMARIWCINGQSVEEFATSFKSGSALNRLLVDRKNGAKLTLEFCPVGGSSTVVELVENHGLPKSWQERMLQ